MRGRRKGVNSRAARTTWVPWMMATGYRPAWSFETPPADEAGSTGINWNPWQADIDVNRRTMMANQSKILRWDGAIWAQPRVWAYTGDQIETNVPSSFLVLWYWHKQKLNPQTGGTTELTSNWSINSDEGSGYPTETDALMMRRDLNRWGQGWCHRVIHAPPDLLATQAGYTVPASVGGDRVAYNVPAVEAEFLSTINKAAFVNTYPLRIPGPKLPVMLDQGEVLSLRCSMQVPANSSDSSLLSSNALEVALYPSGRWLVTT